MRIYLSIEHIINYCNSRIENMRYSEDMQIKTVLQNISNNWPMSRAHSDMFCDEKTLKVLEFCTPYYEYIGVRTNTPERYKNKSV